MFAKFKRIAVGISASVLMLGYTPVDAGETDLSGSVGLELRYFPNLPQFQGQLEHFQPSVSLRSKAEWESENREQQTSFLPFLRIDGKDDERTHFDIREGYWRYISQQWEVLVGFNTVFWGVTESRHLVNIINQVDEVENIDQEEFLGQPMIQFATLRDFGRLDLFVLTGFRERTFPGRVGRLRTPLPVDTDAAQFESDREEAHIDFAVRYAQAVGDWDVGAYVFHGTGREPRLALDSRSMRMVPIYDIINQLGVDVQYTRDAWLWKFEGIVREGQGDTFPGMVAGFEYTFYQVFDSNADVGVLAEYLRDERDRQAPQTPFRGEDLFFGTRFTLNDVQDTSALIGGVFDLDDGSKSFRIEGERRIGESWTLDVEVQAFTDVDDRNILATVRDDDFVTLRMTRYF